MSDLLRYRVTSQDGAPARFTESETGYWTPWYIAERRCNELRQQLEQAQARVAELECCLCGHKYHCNLLQHDEQMRGLICQTCSDKLDRDEEMRNNFGGPT